MVDAIRVNVKSDSEDLQYPVLFVVRQQKGVLSWQVPLVFRGLYQRSYNYTEVSRTLCPSESTPENGSSEQILFPPDVDSVIVKVRSESVYPCSVVSIQDTVKRDFQAKQFFVVFVIKPEDYACGGSMPSSIRGSGTVAASHPISASTPEGSSYGAIGTVTLESKDTVACLADESGSGGGQQLSSLDHRPPCGSDTDSSVEEESDFDTMPEIESDKNVIRTKVVNVTGNQDICYYNFLCAHPLGVLSAFNNILSNAGHLLLGFLFLLIVLRRDILHRRSLETKDIYTMEYGIPKHFGLFYAMGIALMMEGVLSACYHVCPNYSNFQFDTSFMYMIAGLCMLKLYQTRHPDINASAYSAYASFAVVICLAVLGVVFGKNSVWFWVLFSVIHVVASLGLSTQIYYMGRFNIDVSDPDFGIFQRAMMVLYTDCIQQCSRPMYMDRMVLLVVGNLVNWSFAIFGLVYRPKDFASYLLGIFICNLLLYLAFYVIMKETPAESREKNRPCILLGFFDDHDVWHFLSAAALFFSFLVLLTLDDDLDSVRRDKIPVF
ncbi:hypothetical protein JD844_009967 [Phrynosoma platyrhinos]|uniref:SID1 transmembrane family member 1 n=1 Tax=Phrynosoma platyrhinos TaxID=52577 RepID=A0ABQ7TGI5_PHRPL|nr:hypothetical protein JD844_009967 [Phrynosoma platyrhinos]